MKLRLTGVAGLALAAFAIPASSAGAAQSTRECPDNYQPIPTQATPDTKKKEKDRNGNFIVCAKGPQGSNQHYNVKDDKGDTVSPIQWTALQIPTTNYWLIQEDLDPTAQYTLDPDPLLDDIVDDVVTGIF
jgi:hypothetical protein